MGKCIFCGKSPVTDAHIFRKGWVDDVMPLAREYRHRRGGTDSAAREPGDWTNKTIDLKVKSVCQDCNGGWMHRLDLAAEDAFLTHAVIGYPVKLALMEEKITLGRWCSLVATLFDQTLNPPTYPQRVHEVLYAGDVPEDMQAWLFRTQPPGGRDLAWGGNRHVTLVARMRSSGLDVQQDLCITTFCIKELVVQVLQPTEAAPPEGRLRPSGREAFSRQICPPPLTPLIWPPVECLRWDDARTLPDEIERQVRASR